MAVVSCFLGVCKNLFWVGSMRLVFLWCLLGLYLLMVKSLLGEGPATAFPLGEGSYGRRGTAYDIMAVPGKSLGSVARGVLGLNVRPCLFNVNGRSPGAYVSHLYCC